MTTAEDRARDIISRAAAEHLGWPEQLRLTAEAIRDVERRIEEALALIRRHGGTDGEHHKSWVIDQVVRVLAGDDYPRLVAEARAGRDGPETYDWDEGIPP